MNSDKDTLRDEYPENLIRSGVRGKYAKKVPRRHEYRSCRSGPAQTLFDSEAVNRALREYASKKRTAI